jgi:curved DNA-binding protein CbpA
MTVDNAYRILELKSTCTDEEISKSFKKMSMKHHPDKGGNPENFKLIVEARDVLKTRNQTIELNGRVYTQKQYESFLRQYLKDLDKELKDLEKRSEKSRQVLTFRLILWIVWIVKLTASFFINFSAAFNVCTFVILLYMFIQAEKIAPALWELKKLKNKS